MILTIAIIILLILSFWRGQHRGLLKMILNLVTYVIAIAVAGNFAARLGDVFSGWFPTVDTVSQTSGSALNSSNGNQFLYNGIAFIILFLLTMLLCHWLINRLNLITKVPVIHQVNAVLGGVINLVICYVVIFFALTIFQVVPSDWWQQQLTSSNLANWMINNTPLLSNQVVFWLTSH